MKIIYKGFELEAKREQAQGGWDSIYYSIFRQSDGWELNSGFSVEDKTPIKDFINSLKNVVDDYLQNPKLYESDY